MKDYLTFFILVAFISLGCIQKTSVDKEKAEISAQEYTFPYNLSIPDKTWWLPHSLQEISGISPFLKNKVACVQDEKGKVYIYNTLTESIEREFKFAKDGDYEDIHFGNGHFHVLKSNGQIYEFDYVDSSIQSKPITTGLKNLDYEGFCLSNKDNKYLVAPKQHNKLFVYDTEYNFISDSIEITNYDSKKLKASALTLDTISEHIYILSSPNMQLHVLDYNFSIILSIDLSSNVFKQPEGMYLSKDGDLYISNEGRKGKANILKFNRINETNK